MNNQNSAPAEESWGNIELKKRKFTLLKEGYYRFKVVKLTKSTCNIQGIDYPAADLLLEIENDQGDVMINYRLVLCKRTLSTIADFFASLGLLPEGSTPPPWDDIVGKEGGCRLIQKKGDFKTINVVDKFVSKD